MISQVAVVGAGLMGGNIALDFALAGMPVRLTDEFPEALARSQASARDQLRALDAHGRLAEPADRILERISRCASLSDTLEGAELVIEAISEDRERKRQLFARIEEQVPDETILASNTSSFMPSLLAQGARRPERMLVAHYWNPAHLIPLVELVPGPQTAPETVDRLRRLYEEIGKQPVVVKREKRGFIGNRLQFALLREAMALVEEGVATPGEIDQVVTAGFGRRVPATGIFATADLAGLDVHLAICRELFPDLADDQQPPEALTSRVAGGHLGVKSGAGWFEHTPEDATALRQALVEELISRL